MGQSRAGSSLTLTQQHLPLLSDVARSKLMRLRIDPGSEATSIGQRRPQTRSRGRPFRLRHRSEDGCSYSTVQYCTVVIHLSPRA